MPGSSADFGKRIAEETGKWEKAIKAGGAGAGMISLILVQFDDDRRHSVQ
jgi:hypothetical protein